MSNVGSIWSRSLSRNERIVIGPVKGKNANQIERISGIWQRIVYYFKGYTSDLNEIHRRLHSVAMGKSDLLLDEHFVTRFNTAAGKLKKVPKPQIDSLSSDRDVFVRNANDSEQNKLARAASEASNPKEAVQQTNHYLESNSETEENLPARREAWQAALQAGNFAAANAIDYRTFSLAPTSCNIPWSALIKEKEKLLGVLQAIHLANKDATANNFRINDRLTEGGQTLLLWAAENGHQEIFVELLNFKGLHLHRTGPDGKTALRLALEKGHKEIGMALLAKGDGTEVLDNGQTLLHAAAIGGNKDLIAAVLQKHPKLLLLQDKTGQNAAHIAASKGHTDALLALGYSLSLLCQQDNQGKVPVSLAVENGKLETAKALAADDNLQQRLRKLKDKEGRTLAHTLAEKGDATLIDTYKHLNYTQGDLNDITPVHLACWRIGVAPIDAILTRTGNSALTLKDNRGDSPLIYAPKNDRSGRVLDLINTRIDDKRLLANSPGLIEEATRSGNLDLVKALWRKEVSVFTSHAAQGSNTSALHVAAEHGHAEILNFLLQQHNDEVETACKTLMHGKSPLHAAVNSIGIPVGVKLAVAIPLAKKAVVLDADGETALTVYAKLLTTDSDQFLRQLIEHQDINVKALEAMNKHGDTLLHVLARKGHWNLANILLEKVPAMALAKNKAGNTFLHEALYAGHRQFLHQVAKPEFANVAGGKHGKTIWQLAQIARDNKLRNILGDDPSHRFAQKIPRSQIRKYIPKKYECPYADEKRDILPKDLERKMRTYNEGTYQVNQVTKEFHQVHDLEDFCEFAADEVKAKKWDRVRDWAEVGVIPKAAAGLIVVKQETVNNLLANPSPPLGAFHDLGNREQIRKDKNWKIYLENNSYLSEAIKQQLQHHIDPPAVTRNPEQSK